jgi:hypothetical protein
MTFFRCTGIKNIDFPAFLKEIHWKAFEGCTGLTNLVFPAGLEVINLEAFWECRDLESIELHEGLMGIGMGAFLNCRIKNVTLPASLKILRNKAFDSFVKITRAK